MGWMPTRESRLRDATVSVRIAEEVHRFLAVRYLTAESPPERERLERLCSEAEANLAAARRVLEDRLSLPESP
ncbi:MAG TPA: hypothetical protein VNZ52_03320 [Candidatus Thermoplasmatota archaeon]|nr:hypothetical protein [Candidatus Thermoplasmatota archaeon]